MKCARYDSLVSGTAGFNIHAQDSEGSDIMSPNILESFFQPDTMDFYVLVQNLCQQSTLVLPHLEDHLGQMKTTFLQQIHELLQTHTISLDSRLVLGFNEHQQLCLCDETHPDYKRINALLVQQKNLGQFLSRIASESVLFDSLQHLQTMFHHHRKLFEEGEQSPFENYRVCLKGALSHFYFSQ